MGTRNLTLVKENDEYKVAQYGQWDGYPKGQGLTVANFINDINAREAWARFRSNLEKCRFITDEEMNGLYETLGIKPTELGLISWEDSERFDDAHPELSRDTGAKILNMILEHDEGLNLWDDHEFIADDLFCEYAYEINLDTNELICYKNGAHQFFRCGLDSNIDIDKIIEADKASKSEYRYDRE